jgi:hypothetical protein
MARYSPLGAILTDGQLDGHTAASREVRQQIDDQMAHIDPEAGTGAVARPRLNIQPPVGDVCMEDATLSQRRLPLLHTLSGNASEKPITLSPLLLPLSSASADLTSPERSRTKSQSLPEIFKQPKRQRLDKCTGEY